LIPNVKAKGAKRNLRAFFFGCALLPLLASGTPAARPDPFANIRQRQLLDLFLAGTPDKADLGQGGGTTAQTLAMLGREDLVMRMPIFGGHGRRNCQPLLQDGKAVDAITYIAAKAAGVRVTMINEAHDMPQTRSFAAKVAAALRSEGYLLYAGETFDDGIGRSAPSWPLLTDGYYVNDPVYGRLIRVLRSLGYRLVPYEDHVPPDPKATPEEKISAREAIQAKNLEARLKSEPATARLLVHVGYGHLDKSDARPIRMMAAHLREDTGIDPLTIDQVGFWSRTGRYEICDTSKVQPDPTVIYVGAPTPSFTRHRPNWRLEEGDKFVEIPAELRRPSEASIYEARLASDPDTAVAVDRILVRPGEDDMPLLLPPGRYRLSVWTKSQGWSADVALTVN